MEPLLGTVAWINLYRSGDYVGRSVWRSTDTQEELYDTAKPWTSPGGAAAEACIGPGAHTHYWDETADAVARALDSTIRSIIVAETADKLVATAIDRITPS
jgi:hypothetical protein